MPQPLTGSSAEQTQGHQCVVQLPRGAGGGGRRRRAATSCLQGLRRGGRQSMGCSRSGVRKCVGGMIMGVAEAVVVVFTWCADVHTVLDNCTWNAMLGCWER